MARLASHLRSRAAPFSVAGLILFFALLPVAAGTQAPQPEFAVEIDAPPAVRELLDEHLRIRRLASQPDMRRDRFVALYRQSEEQIRELLATEGYFSPRIETILDQQPSRWTARLRVDPGEPSYIRSVDIQFTGFITEDRWDNHRRMAELRAQWPLKVGKRFAQKLWDKSKQELLTALTDDRYAAAQIVHSEARVHPDERAVDLTVVIDSGPPFTLGPLIVEGLSRYPESLVRNLNRLAPGTPYTQKGLTDLQEDLLNTGYFASVLVAADVDRANPENVPIRVSVVEHRSKKLRLAAGFSTDVGPNGEISYTDRNVLGRAWAWTGGLRIAQKEQVAGTELSAPPAADGYRHATSLQWQRTDIQNEVTNTVGSFLRRSKVARGKETEASVGLVWQNKKISGIAADRLVSLPLQYTWTRRKVDDPIDPRAGWLLNGQATGATQAVLSDADFLRGYVKGMWFIPIGRRDTLALRGEAGAVYAPDPRKVPAQYLFRAGGSNSIRGYAYQSIGERVGDAVTGARVLGVVSGEYVHMLTERWGLSAFIDAGDATDRFDNFDFKLGYGAGVRWKSPVGPLSLDLAYGKATEELRIHFVAGFVF
ncbi:autotransporter assembly complex protein TamA [Pelomicrobium methylotrophicum]|uniref:Translocation and assembly module subunit TamA n=1 Tax=Pelomicrobium methylotrophicum TaxID=2602750 RepID=A0A5C7EU26_9PROT|nr:autotransporter assembly complex family protein [Pelomicrobium methylotrophicum]TXF11494.1 outer membrane protein assembly factor [Pelomicrobium methylotrophicum]